MVRGHILYKDEEWRRPSPNALPVVLEMLSLNFEEMSERK